MGFAKTIILTVCFFLFSMSLFSQEIPEIFFELVSIHPESAMVRIGGVNGVLPIDAIKYQMNMVRGEREGFQFAILPRNSENVSINKIEIHKIKANCPAETIYQVLALNHTTPPTDGMFIVPPRDLGLIPDVLMPLAGREIVNVANKIQDKGVPLTYYLEFSAESDQASGNYEYVVEVHTNNNIQKFPVYVQVQDIVLPARFPFRSASCWNWSLNKYFGRELNKNEKLIYWKFFLDYRLSPCSFFGKTPDPTPADLKEFESTQLTLICLMQINGRNPKIISEKEKEVLSPKLKLWRSELIELDRINDAVILLADEPKSGSEEICKVNAKWLKEQFPELKIWIATRPSKEWSAFIDVFDVVTAHSTNLYKAHSHDAEAMAWWRKEKPFPNGEYWLFHSVEPYYPFTNVRLDNLPIEGRISGWQCANLKVDGYEYFWITDWGNNIENKNTSWPKRATEWHTGLSGAGTLCYPDEKMKPMPSLRLVNLRDGFEDWALLGLFYKFKVQNNLIQNLSKWKDFSTDPKLLLDARESIFKEFEKHGQLK